MRVSLAALAAYVLSSAHPGTHTSTSSSMVRRSIPVTSCAAFWSLCLPIGVEAFTPINVQKIPARQQQHDHDVRHGAIDTTAAVVSSADGDGGDNKDADDDEATDIESMIPGSVMKTPKEEEDVDAEAAEEASAAPAIEASSADDTKDDDDTALETTSTSKTKVSASASAAALREASQRRQAAEAKRAQALESAAAKEEDRQLAALTEQRLAAAAAAAIEEERRRQAAILEERREAKRRVVEEETQRALQGEQSLSQAEKNQRFRREAAAAAAVAREQSGSGGMVTPQQAYAREERSAQRQAQEDLDLDLFSPDQRSRRSDLSRAEANRRADAAVPVEVIGASGVASEQRRLDEDGPYPPLPPLRPPRPGGRETDDDRSPGFVGFSNARARYPQKSKWVQKLQAEMLGKSPPMEYSEREEEEEFGYYGGPQEGYVPPPPSLYDDYDPIDVGGGAGGRGNTQSSPLPPKQQQNGKSTGNRVLTPRAPDPSSSSSSSAPSTSPSPGRVPATPVNLERFGDSWFQEQLRASKDEQGGEVHWYEGRRKQMVREEQERRERREAMEAAMERERLERLEREAREAAAMEEQEVTEAADDERRRAVEEDSLEDEERKQRERIAAVLEVDEVRAELEKEREAIKAELEKKRAEATAAREAKLERERMAQEAAAKAVEEKIQAAEEEIAAVEDKMQESVPVNVSVSGASEKDEEEGSNDAISMEEKAATEPDVQPSEKDLDEVPPISSDESPAEIEDGEAAETYNTYKGETIKRRLASLQKDVAKSSEMVEEMAIEVSDLEEEHAHATKMLRRAEDRKNEKLIRLRSDDAAYVKAQLIDMSQELDILKRELACKEELLIIYENRSDMLKRKEWSEGRGPIKSVTLTDWNHRDEKEW